MDLQDVGLLDFSGFFSFDFFSNCVADGNIDTLERQKSLFLEKTFKLLACFLDEIVLT